jgi:hypothetical protein
MNRLTLYRALAVLVFLSFTSLTGCYTQLAAGEANEYDQSEVIYIPYPVPVPWPVPCCDDDPPEHASVEPVKDSGKRDFGSQRPSGESREDDRRGRRPGGR